MWDIGNISTNQKNKYTEHIKPFKHMANLPSANLRSWDVSSFKVFSQNLGCLFHEVPQLVDGLLGSFLRL